MRKRRRQLWPAAFNITLAAAVLTVLSACAGSSATTSAQTSPTFNGQSLYAQHCSACHGVLAEGDGPVANAMRVTVPNLRTLEARSNGTFPRESVARYIDGRDLPAAHGDRYMPVWGDTFAEPDDGAGPDEALANARITAIVDYLERIQN